MHDTDKTIPEAELPRFDMGNLLHAVRALLAQEAFVGLQSGDNPTTWEVLAWVHDDMKLAGIASVGFTWCEGDVVDESGGHSLFVWRAAVELDGQLWNIGGPTDRQGMEQSMLRRPDGSIFQGRNVQWLTGEAALLRARANGSHRHRNLVFDCVVAQKAKDEAAFMDCHTPTAGAAGLGRRL